MQVMQRIVTRACAVAAVGVALGTWAVPAASASGGGSAATGHGALGPVGKFAGHDWALTNDHAAGPAAAAAPISNRTFAGYQTNVPAGSATVVTSSFTLPVLSCTTVNLGIAADAGVVANNTGSIAGVFIGCLNGAATYYPWLLVNGTETDYPSSPFAAGNVINLTANVSTTGTTVQVTDVTTGVTEQLTGAGFSTGAAYVGFDGWGNSSGQLMHVPSFGKLQFKSCLVDGKALASWRPQAYQRVNSVGTLQIATGAFWPGGTAFTTRYEHQ